VVRRGGVEGWCNCKGEVMPELAHCPCGSGYHPTAQVDGYGIFLCYTCKICHNEKMRGWRSDIKERYECDEPIEPED